MADRITKRELLIQLGDLALEDEITVFDTGGVENGLICYKPGHWISCKVIHFDPPKEKSS